MATTQELQNLLLAMNTCKDECLRKSNDDLLTVQERNTFINHYVRLNEESGRLNAFFYYPERLISNLIENAKNETLEAREATKLAHDRNSVGNANIQLEQVHTACNVVLNNLS